MPRDVGIWGHIGGKACGERSLVLRCCPSFPFSRHPRSSLSGRCRKMAPACPLVLIGMGRLGRKHGSRVVGRRMLLGILLIVHVPRLRAAEDRKFDRSRVLGCRTGPRILARIQPRIRRRDVEVAGLGPTHRANAKDALENLRHRGRRLGNWASSLSQVPTSARGTRSTVPGGLSRWSYGNSLNSPRSVEPLVGWRRRRFGRGRWWTSFRSTPADAKSPELEILRSILGGVSGDLHILFPEDVSKRWPEEGFPPFPVTARLRHPDGRTVSIDAPFFLREGIHLRNIHLHHHHSWTQTQALLHRLLDRVKGFLQRGSSHGAG